MKDEDLEFRVHTPNLLKEICDNAIAHAGHMGVLYVPLNTFQSLIRRVAQRATELNDPELNILMLKLALYEVPANEIMEAIKQQRKLIKKT